MLILGLVLGAFTVQAAAPQDEPTQFQQEQEDEDDTQDDDWVVHTLALEPISIVEAAPASHRDRPHEDHCPAPPHRPPA